MSPAKFATVCRAPSNPIVLGFLVALLAERDPVRPTLLFDVLQAGFIRWELGVELVDGIPKMLRNRLLNGDVFSSGHDLVCPIPYVLSRDNCQIL